MAIQENNQQQASTQSNFGGAAPSQPQAQRGQAGSAWSFHQKDLVNAPVSAGVGGEYFTKFRQAIVDVFKDIAEGLEISVLSLNRQNIQGLRFSALVAALRRPELDANTVAYHTLILEATGDALGMQPKLVDGQQINIRRVTSDAFDEVMARLAYDAVSANYPNSHVYSADAMVVPASVVVD